MKVNKTIFTITSLSVLIALEVVLSRFLSFAVWNQKIGFAFVATAVAGMLFGMFGGAVVGGLADLVGALLFPIGAYFPGFTLTNALVGAFFGLFFTTLPRLLSNNSANSNEISVSNDLNIKSKSSLSSLLSTSLPILTLWSSLCAAIELFMCTMLLNTYWISVLYKTPYRELFATRLIQFAIMLPIQIIVLPILYRFCLKLKKSVLR